MGLRDGFGTLVRTLSKVEKALQGRVFVLGRQPGAGLRQPKEHEACAGLLAAEQAGQEVCKAEETSVGNVGASFIYVTTALSPNRADPPTERLS